MLDSKEAEKKYERESSQTDPAYRCSSCLTISTLEQITKTGFCGNCAKRRFEEVKAMSTEEHKSLKTLGVDPLWLSLFEEVANET